MKTEDNQTPSVEEIRSLLAENLLGEHWESESLPASAAQQRLWLIDQMEPNRPTYNIAYVCWLTGPLDETALERAILSIIGRHETLRARFVDEDGEPTVVIDSTARLQLRREDLRPVPQPERDNLARTLVLEESNRPFDLRHGPLIRVTLLRIEPEESVFIVNMHHIISDEWSFKIFYKELETLYTHYHAGKEPELPELPIQYSDYAEWQREWLKSGEFAQQLRFWKEQLAGAPIGVEFPAKFRHQPSGHSKCALCINRLPPELNQSLKGVAAEQKVTLFILLLAAFQVVLHRRTGREDIIIGSPMAARKLLETEPVIGFFANTLPLRARLTPEMPFSELLRQVRQTALGAYSHQEIPLEKIVEALQPERVPGRTPFINILFIFQTTLEQLDLPEITTTFLFTETETAKFDLTLYIGDAERELFTAIEYDTGLFKAEFMEELLRDLEAVLRGVAGNPASPLRDLPLSGDRPETTTPERWSPPVMEQYELMDRWFELRAERRARQGSPSSQ